MPQGKGTYGDQVGRPSKEDKSKGMPYAPFKMSGHTLPGPNQNSSLKMTEEDLWTQIRGGKTAEEFRATMSGARLGESTTSQDETLGLQGGGTRAGGASTETTTLPEQGSINTPAVQAGSGENMNRIVSERSNTSDDISGIDNVKKKKVDVEVTVNGQQV
jgi:hypothetical protein